MEEGSDRRQNAIPFFGTNKYGGFLGYCICRQAIQHA